MLITRNKDPPNNEVWKKKSRTISFFISKGMLNITGTHGWITAWGFIGILRLKRGLRRNVRVLASRNVVAQGTDWDKIFVLNSVEWVLLVGLCSWPTFSETVDKSDVTLYGPDSHSAPRSTQWSKVKTQRGKKKNNTLPKYLQHDSNSDGLHKVLWRFYDSRRCFSKAVFFFFLLSLLGKYTKPVNWFCKANMTGMSLKTH